MIVDRSYLENNDQSRANLLALLDRLSDEEFTRPLDGGWTVGTALAHLAFWDEWIHPRWAYYHQHGTLQDVPDEVEDLVNAAGMSVWRLLTPSQVKRLVQGAADSIDAMLATLDDAAIQQARDRGQLHLLDRASHRIEHTREIEAVTGH